MVRQLEIIIDGIACFIPDGDAYRVLFPDGRTPPDPQYKIPRHELAVWIRPSDEIATARWQWESEENDFTVGDPVPMAISIGGLNATTFNNSLLVNRLPNLKDSDSTFTLDPNRKVWGEIRIDRGTLSAHQVQKGSIVTKWEVEAEIAATIRLTFGPNWLELTPATTQVVFANTAVEDIENPTSDFLLYRHLASAKSGPLAVPTPKTPPPKGGVTIGGLRQSLNPMCPIVDCSNVFLLP